MTTLSAILCLLAVVGGQVQPAFSQSTDQPQQHWVQVDDPDAPAQPPIIHNRTPGIPPPAAPKPAHGHLDRHDTAATAREPGSQAAVRPKVPLFAVVWMSAVMSMMSCLGVLPYFCVRQLSKPWTGLANAVASGVMLTASFALLAEGSAYSGTYLVAGMLLGVLFVRLSQKHLEQYEVDSFEQLAGADARKVILFLAVMAVHAVGEGGGVGVSFAGDRGWAQGTLITLAIGLHNIPEGLAVATVMAAKGTHPSRALLWTALTALPQALVAPPAYVFVNTFRALLPLALGFAAGCMVWIVLAELLPDALEAVESEQVATYATGAAACLQGLSVFMSHLETPSGTLASPFADYQDVLPLGISNLLLHLLPPCLVYGLVATLCAKAQCSKPRVVCAAAGILASYILASGLHLLVHSRHRVLCGLVLPMVGAVVAAATWRRLLHHNTIKPVRTKQHHSNGHLQSSGPGAAWQKAGKGLFNGAAEVAVSPTAAYAGTAPYPRNSHTGQGNSGQWGNSTCMGQQQQQQQHSSSISSSAHTATVNGTNQESPSANSSTSSSSWHSEYAQQQQQLHSIDARSLWCQKSPLQPDGCRQLQLHGGQAFNFSGPNLVIKEGSGSHGWLGVLHNINSSSKRISNPVTGACWLVVCGAAGSGVPLGLQLASALAAAPNSMSHVTVPLALLGAVFVVSYSGLLMQLLEDSGNTTYAKAAAATALSSVPLAAAVAVLLAKPAWVQQGPAYCAVDVLQGLMVGFNITAMLLLLAAANRQWGRRKCSGGLAIGFGVGLLTCAGLALMCWSTPYCLHWELCFHWKRGLKH